MTVTIFSPFLSTPSARRETALAGMDQNGREISIHALREEGDIGQTKICLPWSAISIHALREEGDRSRAGDRDSHPNFYPRPPRGGRRNGRGLLDRGCWDFYPRPPRGGRHVASLSFSVLISISIHALREEGDPAPCCRRCPPYLISIHALREEGDALVRRRGRSVVSFLSTPSARRAT